jgi:hypothetical protein
MSDDKQQVTIAVSVKTLKDNLPAFLEHTRINAIITRQKYLALISNGFNEAQALELCK